MSWKRGTFLIVKENWAEAGRCGTCLGPNIELAGSNVSWTPIRWDGEDDPDWFKTRGLEKRTPNKHAGHV